MAGMAVDGLISGFNTTQMISQLMQLEAAPQAVLKTKVAKAESFVSALQSLNTKLSSLADAAKTAAKPASWGAVTATSTTASVTATATAGAQASSLTFKVDRLATAQTSLSGSVTTLTDIVGDPAPGSLTMATGADGAKTYTSISMAGVTDLAGLASAINKADAGVTATLINVGDGSSRLQLTGADTGTAAGFDLYAGSVDAGSEATTTAIMGRTATTGGAGSTVIAQAGDAQITLWGTQPVTSATNTFADVVAGLSFTLSAVEEKDVTVTVGRDDTALKKIGSDLVANISTVLTEIASRSKSTTTKGADGREVVKGGIFSADSSIRSMQQSVLSAASQPVNGTSPSSIGIVLGKDGTMSFDEKKFTAALAADPAAVQAVVAGVAERLQRVTESLSDPATGSLSLKIQGQQSYVRNLNDQVDSWDNRLSLRRSTLERTYAAMEVSLNKLHSQGNWMASQIAQMNAAK